MNDWIRLIAGCFVALLCLLPTGRLYAGDKVKFKVNNADGFSITYEVKEGTKGLVSVTDAKVTKKAVLRIPETVEYEGQTYTVVEIADRAFGTNGDHGKPFSAVELPSTLRRIGKFAFQWCNRLERIELPEGLLIIDAYAFVYTYSLKQLSIPSSVIYIGSMAFQNWKPLNINYPKTCELGNLPAIVTPDNCEQYGLDTKSVARYYATNQASVPIVDVNSEDIQRLIAAWNSASDAKWSKRMKIAQVAGVVGVAMGAVAESHIGISGTANSMPQMNSIGVGTVAEAIARTDQIMANAQQNIQQIGEQAVNQVQQGMQRSERAIKEQLSWSTSFNAQNGRYPTQLEQDEWMRLHYPDVYQIMLQARAAQTVREGSVESSKEDSESASPEKDSKNCRMCVGKGGVTGKCYFCVDGYITDNSFGTLRKRRCSSCKTEPGICEYCHGTGTTS